MRWNNLLLVDPPDRGAVTAPLFDQGAVVRTFDTPEFKGITFYEIRAKSIINRVPEASRVPFKWTINPYRGCSHACFYCFARNTHTYLDMDYGEDFNNQIVVKVNAAERLRVELAAPRWKHEHIAMGTNVDPYQRAEGRYKLMRGLLEALRDAANPFSILTKGALILRDLPLLEQAADVTDVSAAVSVGFLDDAVWRSVEPGTPPPQRRLDVARTLNEAGISCGVLMAPVLPYLTDSDDQLESTVAAVAATGAPYVSPIVLHLRPGAREWWQAWMRRERPDLLPRYRALYGERSDTPKAYQHEITAKVRALADRYGVGRTNVLRRRTGHERARLSRPQPTTERPARDAVQLELL